MRYSNIGEKYQYCIFDWLGYLDRLLGDLNLEARRKRNEIAELFAPYGPNDYNDCLEEYLKKRRVRDRKASSYKNNPSLDL